jgi:hypothetical protein
MNLTSTEKLLDKLCTELGFCLHQSERDLLIALYPTSVKAFTDAVFVAEGLDPQLADRRLWRQVRDLVSKHFDAADADDAV